MGSVSSLIPSGVSAPSEETRHTFTNRNLVYFPFFFVLSHPADSFVLSSLFYLLKIRSSVIRLDIFWSCYSVHLIHFRKLRCRVRLRIVQQSSCIINEDTLHPAAAVLLETSVCIWKFSKFYQVEDSVLDNLRKLDAIQHSYIQSLLCIWKSLQWQCLESSFGSRY